MCTVKTSQQAQNGVIYAKPHVIKLQLNQFGPLPDMES